MTDDTIQQTLKQKNPFISSSIGDPWDDSFTDVPSINQDVYQSILDLIHEKNKKPSLPCAALICGEVGSGKTHFIGRLLRQSNQTDCLFYIAYIQPIEDPDRTFSYLLRELINNLCHPILNTNTTPLDRLVDQVVKSAMTSQDTCMTKSKKLDLRSTVIQLKNDTKRLIHSGTQKDFNRLKNNLKNFLRQKHPNTIPKKTSIEIMRNRFPGISKSFFKVLFQYNQSLRKNAAISWLKGLRLDDEDTALLAVPDRNRLSDKALEEESRLIIDAIGQLLSCYGWTLLVCFDRLENLETNEQIHSLGKMIEFIVDTSRAMLPITFIRGSEWQDKFKISLNQHVVTRLETNEYQLKGCVLNDSKAILKKRLSFLTHDTDFPFSDDMLAQMYKETIYFPRQVIITANRKLKEQFEPSDINASKNNSTQATSEIDLHVFFNHVNQIKQTFQSSSPDKQRLIKATNILIQAHVPDIQLIPHIAKRIDFLALSEQSKRRAAFIIDTELNNSSVRSALNHGVQWKNKNPHDSVIYIRDLRTAIPKQWDKTHEMLQTFTQSGCHLLLLSETQAPFWFALTELAYTLKENGSDGSLKNDILPYIQMLWDQSNKEKLPSSFERLRKIILEGT